MGSKTDMDDNMKRNAAPLIIDIMEAFVYLCVPCHTYFHALVSHHIVGHVHK